ncbi:BQ2448_3830 [Microbotryum intermedium]|uniref:BQ2448_3830 protein n=1 Tax=Microbotryum intermedium TaxID=269621 RepID=A0A238FIQ8_9BASI|nr:BQ2448_3830 [Microbotryum intermedium]
MAPSLSATSAATPSAAAAQSEYYPEDVVSFTTKEGKTVYAVVTRCWADEQNPEAAAEAERLNVPFMALPQGKLQVLHPTGYSTLVSESTVSLVNREFLPSDLVRRRGGQGQAGIIVDLDISVQLQRVLHSTPSSPTDQNEPDLEIPPEWYNVKDLCAATRMSRGDHVVYQNWVGMIEEVFEMAIIETNQGVMRRVCDVGAYWTVGPASEEHHPFKDLLDPLNSMQAKRVRDVKQLAIAVNWLCTNQRRPCLPHESDDVRPKRYWSGSQLSDLLLVRAGAQHLHSIGDKVVFRDPAQEPPRPAGSPILSPTMAGDRVFVIVNSCSKCTVLWQDGTRSTDAAHRFEHCTNLDEDVNAFPGDVGVFNGVSPPRVAIVQAMDSKKRTIRVKYYDHPEEGDDLISGLEFDQIGAPPEIYHAKRHEVVLITQEGWKHAYDPPTIPRLGDSEVVRGTFPDPDQVRYKLSKIGMRIANDFPEDHSSPCFVDYPLPKTQPEDLSSVDWYGFVADLSLDGQLVIELPSKERVTLPMNQLYHLDDGVGPDGEMEPLDDEDGEESMMNEDQSDASWETDNVGMEATDGMSMPGAMVWEDDEDEEDIEGWADREADEVVAEGGFGVPVTDIVVDEEVKPVEAESEPTTNEEELQVSMPSDIVDDERWSRFLILEQAPSDHHYIKEIPLAPSKQFMSRVQKEQKVLASSLPPNILVRAYEDRADLLRCLIIGPLGTPFQNAPFLFDVYLSPTTFPTEPPQVFFHAWVQGTRVSPNLYSEGKVCLSLLNTWTGTAIESWNASRSSILQVFISIQSLIMVENPYYTEPGFEKQVATPEGQAASDLYNERTFVLTRAFVKRAVEYPPLNFEQEVKAYYSEGLGRDVPGALGLIVRQSRALLEESGQFEEEQGSRESNVVEGLKVLTEGAGLSLKRTLASLDELVVA